MLGILQVIKRHFFQDLDIIKETLMDKNLVLFVQQYKTELLLQIPLTCIFNYYFTGMSERTAEQYAQHLDNSQQHQNHQEDHQQYLDSQQILDQQNLDHQEHQNHRHNDNSVVQGRAWAN